MKKIKEKGEIIPLVIYLCIFQISSLIEEGNSFVVLFFEKTDYYKEFYFLLP